MKKCFTSVCNEQIPANKVICADCQEEIRQFDENDKKNFPVTVLANPGGPTGTGSPYPYRF